MPTNQPPRSTTRPPTSAEKIMETQQEILRLVRELLTPISSEVAATDPRSQSPAVDSLVATMIELLQHILTGVNRQQNLLEAIAAMLRGGSGADVAISEASRRPRG